jgi:DNA-binding LacI/PurR family transcriptional regulator
MSGSTTPGRTTLAHVARHAGVSTSTASLAFSGAGPVAESTRQRVLDAAAALGYAGPDPTARSLRQGRSGVVGAVVGERLLYAFRDPVAIAMLDGLTEVLGPAGSALLLLSGNSEQRGPSLSQVAGLPLDAVVFATCGGDDDPILEQLRRRAVPLIGIEGPHSPDVSLVDIDNRGSSARLARHLLELGHQRVGVVALPLLLDGRGGWVDDDRRRLAAYADCRLRLAGVEDAVGHRVPAVEAPSNRIEEGRRAGRLLLEAPPAERPTAVVAQSDLLAVGVVQAAGDLGLRVPDDVSVAGYDGIETPWLGNAELTTVVQPSAEKGRAAGRMVLDLLAGRRPVDVLLPVRLQVGTTTGPVPLT